MSDRNEHQAHVEREGAATLEGRRWRILSRTSSAVSILLAGFFVAYTIANNKPLPGHAARAGSSAPDFSALDVQSGRVLRLADLGPRPILLYFSKGASCRACLVQAAQLQRAPALTRRGVRLVVISTDRPAALRLATRRFGIVVPALADSTARMSFAYAMVQHGGAVGHIRSDGHAFALIRDGRVVWHDAYPQMNVSTRTVLRDVTSALAANAAGRNA